jgi:hypothetical protein
MEMMDPDLERESTGVAREAELILPFEKGNE